MEACRKPVDNLGGASRRSSLEGLLQQAWLQTQSRPKLAKRSTSDPLGAADEKRSTSSQSSFARLMSRSDAGDQATPASEDSSSYFHKTRSEEVPEFLRRRAVPRLESYSKKTQKPQRRSSGSKSDGVSQASSMFSSSESDHSNSFNSCGVSNGSSGTHASMDDLFDAVDSEGGSADLVVETEVLDSYFSDFLSNDRLGLEKCLMQLTTASHATKKKMDDVPVQCSAVDENEAGANLTERWNNLTIEEFDQRSLENCSSYQAMAAEIASLLSSEPQVEDGEKSSDVIFAPSEELTGLKIMEGFTSMMSKHIQDVSACNSDTVDYRTWITEDSDKIDASFDDAWKTYFEKWHHSLPMQSSLDSNLLPGEAEDSNLTPGCANMTEMLYRCAFAVSRGDHHSATEGLEELRKNSSPYGSAMERMAHYVREALVARMSGTGEELYTVITNNHPSAETMLKAFRVCVDNCPYVKLKHFLSTKSILDACEGADRVHVIHYGALFGAEWPSLLKHLSERPEGPPHFRLTAIDIPYPVGDDPLKKLKGMGWRLEQFANQYRVPFEFQALAGNWESFTARDMNIRKAEVLAVSSNRTHLIHDEGVLGASPRELLLKRIRSLDPKVVVLYVESAACNAPFFMTRFRESVKHYSALYDSLEIAVASDAPERTIIEREVLGRELLNIIACEGHARIERAEPYRQWQNRMERAGFILRPLNPIVFSKIKAMMASFHQDFGVGDDDGWLLMGIKDQITCASGVWEPKPVMSFINT